MLTVHFCAWTVFSSPPPRARTYRLVSRKSFEFLRDRQRNCQPQLVRGKSLKCTELLGPFAAGISAWIQAWIAEVCFNLNNDLQSQTEQRTFLRVTPLNMCPFHPGDRSPCLTECLLGKLWEYVVCCCPYQNVIKAVWYLNAVLTKHCKERIKKEIPLA